MKSNSYTSNRKFGYFSAAGLLTSIVVANWVTTRYGFIPVGFGYQATAGTFAAGFALALRDGTQDLLGKRVMFAVIAAGAAVSYLIADPFIAAASVAAFVVAELVDFAVYTPLRNKSRLGDRRWAVAVGASSIAGALADTAIFLGIAFGWAAVTPAIAGQMLGKIWATVLYLAVGKMTAMKLGPYNG